MPLAVLGVVSASLGFPADEADRRSAEREAARAELVQRDRSLSPLESKVDPRLDEAWPTEAFEAEAKDVLKVLADLLAAGAPRKRALDRVFVAGARSVELRSRELEADTLPSKVTVARVPPSAAALKVSIPAARALRDLVRPFRGMKDRRFTFKVIEVRQATEALTETRIRYEGAGESASERMQQTGTWWADWVRTDAGVVRVATIRRARLDEVTTEASWFADRTASVIPEVRNANSRLLRGGDFWYGRMDGLGEPNLMGHQGIAVGDVNGDDLEDLYVAMGTGQPNRLFVQQADGSLVDRAEAAGVAWLDDTKGVVFADMDNDGDQDLLCAMGPVIVLNRNDGNGNFDRVLGLRAPTPAAYYSISVVDYDLDGDLDVYGTRYVKTQYGVSVPIPFHDARNGPTNHLLRNEGDGRFVDATAEAGLDENNSRFSLVGAWADYDDDGDPDLYVANDFGRNNLYRNDGGKFTDVAAQAGAEDQAAGMGVSWADVDGDGDLDLHVTNMFSAAGRRVAYQSRFHADSSEDTRLQVQRHSLGNTLLVNQGDGTFRDHSEEAGVRMGRWGWGARFVDLDNDGNEDLVVPNGFVSGALDDDL